RRCRREDAANRGGLAWVSPSVRTDARQTARLGWRVVDGCGNLSHRHLCPRLAVWLHRFSVGADSDLVRGLSNPGADGVWLGVHRNWGCGKQHERHSDDVDSGDALRRLADDDAWVNRRRTKWENGDGGFTIPAVDADDDDGPNGDAAGRAVVAALSRR